MVARAPRRRSYRIALSVLVVLLLLNGLAFVFRRPLQARSDTYHAVARVDACENLGRTPDVVYLGSSRTVYGIDAPLVDSTLRGQSDRGVLSCNAGAIGSTFEQDYYTLKRLIADGHAPKAAVETLWEWNINVNASRPAPDAADHFAQVEHLASLSDLPRLLPRFASNGWNPLQLAVGFVAEKTIPLYGERIGILKTLCGPVLAGPCGENVSRLDGATAHIYTTADRQGWIAAPEPSIAQLSRAKVAANRAHGWTYMRSQERNFQIGGLEISYLNQLLTLAARHHVRVALVVPPLSQYFWDYFSGPTSWAQVMAFWQGTARAHGAAFYDESRAPGYTDADFVDPQHLSSAGAHTFSRWLARAVVPPLVR